MTTTSEPALPGPSAHPRAIGVRLSTMMFLQYAVGGLWVPLLGTYLKDGLDFSQDERGWIMGVAGTVGALASPLVAGQLADRYFRTQRLMAVLLMVSGVVMWITAYQTVFAVWLLLSVVFSLVSAPTGLLANSLSFTHMTDPDRQFPRVRVWGTIGWIAAGWLFAWVWLLQDLHLSWLPPFLVGSDRPDVTARLADALKAAGIVLVLYGLYCLTLPDTRPQRHAREALAIGKALRMLRRRSFAVLMGCGIVLAAVHQIYFMEAGNFLMAMHLEKGYIPPAMSLGQIFEILMVAVLGLLLKRLGFKPVLLIGALAYVARYAIFAATGLPLWIIVASQGLHGVCFACFMAAACIYVDRVADKDVRHSAQMVFGLALACGPIVGGWLNGALGRCFTPAGGELNYSSFWLSLSGIALAATIVLAAFFVVEGPAAREPPPASA